MPPAEQRLWSAVVPIVIGELLIVSTRDAGLAAMCGLAIGALIAYRARMWWVAACAAAWAAVFLAVRILPGPYDSWAGKAAVPVLAAYAAAFLGAWVVGRRFSSRGVASDPARPELVWPSEPRLRTYLLVLLGVAAVAAVIRFWAMVPPLFADNPDAARQVLRERSNIAVGLLSEAWTLGLSISLLRAMVGSARGSRLYFVSAFVFAVGAALGASKNSVLVGVVPALIAALSVRRSRPPRARSLVKAPAAVLIGVAVVGAAVFLGGQRTLAGSGTFETEFRARYGDNALATSAGSLDLSLSSSAETFGRLWVQREGLSPAYGAYSLMFLGSRIEPVVGHVDLYGLTSQVSMPYYMNTATFVAIPLLDYGPIGAAVFLAVLGLCVGVGDRRLEFSAGPAQQLGRGFIVYFAVFGVYELYPFIYPTWLSLIPGLWVLHRLARPAP